jgi:hypothetical protein
MRELVSVPLDSKLKPPTGKGWSAHWTTWALLNCGIWNLFNICFSSAYCRGNWLASAKTLPYMAIHRPNIRFYYTDTFC